MSSELDAIKARAAIVAGIQDRHDEPSPSEIAADSRLALSDVDRLVAALEAVLELHEPTESSRHAFTYCCECSDVEVGLSVLYPCPTVHAIHTALGEGE